MPELADKLRDARAEVERLERLAASASCQEIGCDFQSIGGCNCGCRYVQDGERCEGQCSVPVMQCTRCGDCDYGNNVEADEKRADCAMRR